MLQRHPLSAVWGDMPQDEFLQLVEDIRQRGLLEPILTLDALVLDGWHRYRACREAGLELTYPQILDYDEEQQGDAAGYVIARNALRRHLTASQRAAIVVSIRKWRPRGGDYTSELSAPGADSSFTNVQLSQEAGAGERTIRQAKVAEDAGLGPQVRSGELSAKQAAAMASTGAVPHVANNAGNNEHYTPPEYIKAARKAMGGIDIDPATSEAANLHIVKASVWYDKDTDGLEQPWEGCVWLNPPYSFPLIQAFIEKLLAEYQSKRVSQACVLVNNATDTGWFNDILAQAAAVCFPHGRLRFYVPSEEGVQPGPSTPLQGQAVLYLGEQKQSFKQAFKQFGLVVHVLEDGCLQPIDDA